MVVQKGTEENGSWSATTAEGRGLGLAGTGLKPGECAIFSRVEEASDDKLRAGGGGKRRQILGGGVVESLFGRCLMEVEAERKWSRFET